MARAAAPVGDPPPPAAERAGTHGQLNIQSNPRSSVVLDGRTLGLTPRFGVSVAPGSHSVVFTHPEGGKKTLSVSIAPGESKNVAVQF